MKKSMALFAALLLAGSLVSCGNDSSSSSNAEPASAAETEAETGKDTEGASTETKKYIGDKTIGIAMPASELDRWNQDGEYLKNQFETYGYKVDLRYSNNDPVQQNQDIKDMIEQGADLLLIAAVDSTNLAETLDEAKENGITVVAYDRLIMDTEAVTYYISFDNYGVGKLQAKFIRDYLDADITDGPYNIELVAGDAGDNNAKCFFDGAYEILKPYITSGKFVVPSGETTFEQAATDSWLSDNAETDMKATLAAKYADGTKLDAVLCANDSTALGVENALDTDYTGGNTPIITGQDGDIPNLKNIVDGKQSMTVYKNLTDETAVAFEVCKYILDGNIPTAKLAESMPVEVSYDTSSYNNGTKYVQSYLLEPYVITKDNLQTLVDTGNFKWDDAHKYLEAANS